MSKQDKFTDIDDQTKTQTKEKLKKPSLYKVLLLNDDYTPMEFVIFLLQKFFQEQTIYDISIFTILERQLMIRLI